MAFKTNIPIFPPLVLLSVTHIYLFKIYNNIHTYIYIYIYIYIFIYIYIYIYIHIYIYIYIFIYIYIYLYFLFVVMFFDHLFSHFSPIHSARTRTEKIVELRAAGQA